MKLADAKKGQIIYRYRLDQTGDHVSDEHFVLERFRVVQKGSIFTGYVRLGKNDEVRYGVQKTRFQEMSFEATPAEARKRLIQLLNNEITSAQHRLADTERKLRLATEIT